MSDTSILDSTKKILGLASDYTPFDLDIITHINSSFNVLHDLGIGPNDGFMIEDSTPMWGDFIGDSKLLNSVKTYVYLKVRLVFDPPATSYALDAMKAQILELEWRINVRREATDYVSPGEKSPWSAESTTTPIKIQGGLDWWVGFTYKGPDDVPIPVTNVRMEIRGRDGSQSILFTTKGSRPTLLVDLSHSPKVIVKLPGSVTRNMPPVEGWFDAYADDPDGKLVQLSSARFISIESNVSTL